MGAEGRMRVALTGAAGHLGSLVLARLVADPAVSLVHAVDPVTPWLASRKCRHFAVDITDPVALGKAVSGCDAVIHMAFNVDRPDAPERMRATNVDGSAVVARACAENHVGRLVFVSSGAAYGFAPDRPLDVDETVPTRDTPDFLYAHHKWASEQAAMEAAARSPGMSLAILRPAICIGPHAKTAFAVLMRKRRIVCVADTPLQMVWDEDLADAVLRALHASATGAFNIGTAAALTYSEIAAEMGAGLQRVPKQLALAAVRLKNRAATLGLARAVEEAWVRYAVRAPNLIADRARADLAWQPAFPTAREAIRHFGETVPDARSRRLVLMRAALPPRTEQTTRDPWRINLHLTGRHGGDLVVHGDGRWVVLRPGRERGADAITRMPMAAFARCLLSRPRVEAGAGDAGIDVWGDEPDRVRSHLLETLTAMARALDEAPMRRALVSRLLSAA